MERAMKKLTEVCVVVLTLSFATGVAGENQKKRPISPMGVSGTPTATVFAINKAAAWYEANGEQERIPGSGNAGLFYPSGTLANAVYSAGIIWSGNFYDTTSPVLRTNGQSYNNGTKPGAILGLRTGVVEDPSSPDVRIWKIRRDYRTADLKQEASYYYNIVINTDTSWMITALRQQYEKDWREWPASKGAPFYDHDGDGVYTPQFDTGGNPILYPAADEPGLADADGVVWYVCNDIGVAEPWVCPASGIEEQTTIWGYKQPEPLANVIFKRFRLIYKGIASTPDTAHIDNLYVAQWSDIDVGDAGDDFAGCDTLLNVGYEYNGEPTDAIYSAYGLPPAASGYTLLQGPIVPGATTDSAVFDLKRVYGKRNLPATAFIALGITGCGDPPFSYAVALQWNQLMRGLPACPIGPPDPAPMIDPVTGKPTRFWLSGDPVMRTGWIDGIIDPPGDRRILLSSGPCSMVVGDTQEFVVAWVGGLGINYLSSVAVMKYNAGYARELYGLMVTPTGVAVPASSSPKEFALLQNYPNPFNPSTAISYQLSAVSLVRLKVYDILGREVATLVNGRESAGMHTLRFDGSGLASGVYFYRLTAGGMSQTRKMLLVR